MFPFTDTAPRAAFPLVTITMIVINSLVFLWMESLPPQVLDVVLAHIALIPVRYTEPGLARSVGLDPSNYWPLLTNTFMHGGWLHLISNMWFLWIFGPAMEARFRRLGFAFLYLAGAVVASLVHVYTHPESVDPVLGASGAIAAIIAAHAVSYPRARVVTVILLGFIPLFLPLPAVLFALIWIVLQLMQGSMELMSPHLAGGVAWWAHVGGFAFGAAFAVLASGIGDHGQVPTTTWVAPPRRHVPIVGRRDWD
ncbi:MAG TPA: rhomboid family intramembrane serine protease [Xanthobacteraceae bacterium]|nr:rhomboid family intramembrane serine protease [Xanthobacteraceae bacterium]